MVFGCVLAANAMVWLLLLLLGLVDPAWAALWPPRVVIGICLFAVCTATAAFAPWKRVVTAALVIVLAYTLWNMVRAGAALVASGAWSPALGG